MLTRQIGILSAVASVAVYLAGCSPVAANADALIAEAKLAVAKEANVKGTPAFRNVRLAPEVGAKIIRVICGEIKGPSEGAKTPEYRRFIYNKGVDLVAVEEPLNPAELADMAPDTREYREAFDDMWSDSCMDNK